MKEISVIIEIVDPDKKEFLMDRYEIIEKHWWQLYKHIKDVSVKE